MPCVTGPVNVRTTLPAASATVISTAGASSSSSVRSWAALGYGGGASFFAASFSASRRFCFFVLIVSFR